MRHTLDELRVRGVGHGRRPRRSRPVSIRSDSVRSPFSRLPLALRGELRRLGAIPLSARLGWLAAWYGTDKGSSGHAYTAVYQRHLRLRRWERLRVLEIGVGGEDVASAGGASLRMWRSFFPRARIVGVDIREKRLPREKRITVVQGDQADVAFLEALESAHGPFDVVIDDGSHRGSDIIATFNVLWPRLRPRGVYVIEDLATAYDVAYGGGEPGAARTAMTLVKELLDDVQRADLCASVHVYPEIAFAVRR